MVITDVSTQVTRLVNLIQATNKTVVVKPGSVIHDAFVLPTASAYAWANNLATYAQILQSLDAILAAETNTTVVAGVAEALDVSVNTVLTMLSAAIDQFALNFGVPPRKAATAAQGLVQFLSNSAPSVDITVSSGTELVSTSGARYVTTSTVVLPAASAASFYDPALDAYAVTAVVQSQDTGSATDAAEGTITSFYNGTAPSGVDGVTNQVAVNAGYDAETDAQFVARIKSALAGQSLQSAAGMQATVLGNTVLRSAFIADAQSPYQLRNDGNGGVVDIYVKDVIPVSAVDTFGANSSGILANQPLVQVLSVYDGSGTFTVDVDYVVVQDVNPLVRGSYRATDRIAWLPTAGRVPSGTWYVSYAYNYAVTAAQLAATSVDKLPVMGDPRTAILARQGLQVLVKTVFQLVLNPSNTLPAATIIANAKQAVQNYIDSLDFGQELDVSSVIAVLVAVSGVVRVVTEPIYFCVYNTTTSTYGANMDPIPATGYEYIVAREIDFSY